MRKWISILMTVALVFTTIMPAASHASMHNDRANTAIAVSDHHADHHHTVEVAGDTHAAKSCCDHAGKKPCCGHGKMCCKDMCKCPGGNCNGGLAKLLGSGGGNLPDFASSQASFCFTEEHTESAYLSRLRRPPKA